MIPQDGPIGRYKVITHFERTPNSVSEFWHITVDEPLEFTRYLDSPAESYGPGITPKTQVVHGYQLAVCAFPATDTTIARTVIHCAQQLLGDAGISYGAFGARILDGVYGVEAAMRIFGYLPEEQKSWEVDREPNVHWMVYPQGANEWMTTHSIDWAAHVRSEAGEGNVIEFVERDPKALLAYIMIPE